MPRSQTKEEKVVPPDPPLEDLNHTELVAICMDRGLGSASRDIPRETLIKVLREEEGPEALGDPVNRHRKAVAKFLEVYDQVVPQLRCDKDHSKCPPAMVLACFDSAMPEVGNYYE